MNSRHNKKEPPWATTATMEFATEGAEPLESRGSKSKPAIEDVIDAQQVPLIGLERFEQWKEAATKEQLKAAVPYCEKDLRGCYGHGKKWRLTTGAALYRHREIFKKLGRHDWQVWVEKELGVKYPTAWSYMNEWKFAREAEGQSSPNIGEDADAAVGEELSNGVTADERPRVERQELQSWITLPKIPVSHELRSRYVDLYKKESRSVKRLCRDLVMQLVGPEPDAEENAPTGESGESADPTPELENAPPSSASLVPQPEPAPATA
jgi:hypothetical protein